MAVTCRSYLGAMIERVFGPSAYNLNGKLRAAARSGEPINMEACLNQLTLDVVGKAVFNYDFDSLNSDSPLIQAVYTALKETEQRATDLLPVWKVNCIFVHCALNCTPCYFHCAMGLWLCFWFLGNFFT